MEIKNRVRWTLSTFIFAGIMGLVGVLLRGPVPLPSVDVDAWASAVTNNQYFVAQVLILFAYVLPFLGFWGLYASLSDQENVERIAFWGFMASIIGTSLAIATLGVFSYISPVLAENYLMGDHQSPEIITQVATGKPAAINLLGGFLYLLGTLLLGIAVWRSNSQPKWIGLLLGLHGISLVFGFMYYPLLILSWLFFLAAGVWLFIIFRR
jgi:hypothetical protein